MPSKYKYNPIELPMHDCPDLHRNLLKHTNFRGMLKCQNTNEHTLMFKRNKAMIKSRLEDLLDRQGIYWSRSLDVENVIVAFPSEPIALLKVKEASEIAPTAGVVTYAGTVSRDVSIFNPSVPV